MSKYSTLPNSELIPSKMTRLQGLEKYLLWRHIDVIEALNYSTLPNYELIPSKMAKLQYPEKYLLWRHTDVMEALNLEIYNFLKNLHQTSLPNLNFLPRKIPKLQGCLFNVSHYDIIMTFIQAINLKMNKIFEKTGQNNPSH